MTVCLVTPLLLVSGGLAQDKKSSDDRPSGAERQAEKQPEKKESDLDDRPDLSPGQLRELMAARKINAALNEVIDLQLRDTPLSEVLQDIGKAQRIPIVLDPEGCEIARVQTDQPITLSLKSVTLRNALRALLKPLQLSFVVNHEVLTVTALDCPDRLATVRTFPLGDLVRRMDDPSELIDTLETMWPEADEQGLDQKSCKPRARILANHLVVRGSPRHLNLAEQLIDGLMAEPPQPEVKATLTLPGLIKPAMPPRDQPKTKEPGPRYREPGPQFREPSDREAAPTRKPKLPPPEEPEAR
jgi:hypothetical protein